MYYCYIIFFNFHAKSLPFILNLLFLSLNIYWYNSMISFKLSLIFKLFCGCKTIFGNFSVTYRRSRTISESSSSSKGGRQ